MAHTILYELDTPTGRKSIESLVKERPNFSLGDLFSPGYLNLFNNEEINVDFDELKKCRNFTYKNISDLENWISSGNQFTVAPPQTLFNVKSGEDITLDTGVTLNSSTASITYEWSYGQIDLPHATSSTLDLNDISKESFEGKYRVKITMTDGDLSCVRNVSFQVVVSSVSGKLRVTKQNGLIDQCQVAHLQGCDPNKFNIHIDGDTTPIAYDPSTNSFPSTELRRISTHSSPGVQGTPAVNRIEMFVGGYYVASENIPAYDGVYNIVFKEYKY